MCMFPNWGHFYYLQAWLPNALATDSCCRCSSMKDILLLKDQDLAPSTANLAVLHSFIWIHVARPTMCVLGKLPFLHRQQSLRDPNRSSRGAPSPLRILIHARLPHKIA